MLAGATGSAYFQSDTQMIRPDLAGVQQAPQQRVLGARDGMQRPSAIEDIFESLGPVLGSTAAAVLDLDSVRYVARRNNSSGDDLQLSPGDRIRDYVRDLGSDAVAVDVPPRARMAKEPLLLVQRQALPQMMAVGAQAVDRRAPADLGAPPPQPTEHRSKAIRQRILVDRRGIEVGVSRGDQPPP